MTKEQIDTMTVADGWGDGRDGFVWCRLDAVIREEGNRRLFAELTWDDSSDDDDTENGDPIRYYDPQLLFELTEWPNGFHGDYKVLAESVVKLTEEDARLIAANHPKNLLFQHHNRIARLDTQANGV